MDTVGSRSRVPFKRSIPRAVLRDVSPMVARPISVRSAPLSPACNRLPNPKPSNLRSILPACGWHEKTTRSEDYGTSRSYTPPLQGRLQTESDAGCKANPHQVANTVRDEKLSPMPFQGHPRVSTSHRDSVKVDRAPVRAQAPFFNIPCSRAYCTSSAFVLTPRCPVIHWAG